MNISKLYSKRLAPNFAFNIKRIFSIKLCSIQYIKLYNYFNIKLIN